MAQGQHIGCPFSFYNGVINQYSGDDRVITLPASTVIPLRADDHGVIRIGATRVTLESVIYAFRRGATPETIVEKYLTLTLAEVYLVTAYYLQNLESVDRYIRDQEAAAEIQREQVEQDFPARGLRARLLAKLEAKRD